MTEQLRDLKTMIEFASKTVDTIFRQTGALYPMYHAISASGETKILTPRLDDKDLTVALVKAWLVLEDIDRYVFMDEAWILDDSKGKLPPQDWEKIQRYGVSNHPDRREVIMFNAENRRGERQTASRFILRPETGKPKLTPLKIDDMTDVESSGRMVGLFNWEKRK